MPIWFLFKIFLIFAGGWVAGDALLVWQGERTWLQAVRNATAVLLLIFVVYMTVWLSGVT